MENDEKKYEWIKKAVKYFFYGGLFVFVVGLIYANLFLFKKSELKNTDIAAQKNNVKMVEAQQGKSAEKIQVFLFHGTSRCYSCITAGKYTKEILERNFSKELESGKIEFREINIDLSENKELAIKFKASGTAFFINQIIGGQDNIKEDTQVWRLVSNKDSFTSYLLNRLNGILNLNVDIKEK